MSDAANTEFAPDVVLSQAQTIATSWVLTTIGYLKERGLAVEEYVAYHGRRFAPGWEELRSQPVAEVAQLVALNAVSVGCTLRSLSGDDTRAEALIVGWPDQELASFLQLPQSDSDHIWNTHESIMEYLGLRYVWQREDDVVRITLERRTEQ
jgi:hypothetical protein